MILYPTIELQNGRCVSLFQGRLDEPQIWHVDPVKKAREFAEAGAEWIHVTDFDAINGDTRNRHVIDAIIGRALFERSVDLKETLAIAAEPMATRPACV